MAENFDSLIGKTIIIGITRLDTDGAVFEQIQMHGTVQDASAGGIVVRLSTGSCYKLPPDYGAINEAPPGEYRFRSTGEVVSNLDYMTTWTIHPPVTSRTDNGRGSEE